MGVEAFLRRGAVFFCSGICFSVFCWLIAFETIGKAGGREEETHGPGRGWQMQSYGFFLAKCRKKKEMLRKTARKEGEKGRSGERRDISRRTELQKGQGRNKGRRQREQGAKAEGAKGKRQREEGSANKAKTAQSKDMLWTAW